MRDAADATARSTIVKNFATNNFDGISDALRTSRLADVTAVISAPTTWTSLD